MNGNEQVPIFQYLLANSPFPYPSRSLKTTTKTAFRIENGVKFVKILDENTGVFVD